MTFTSTEVTPVLHKIDPKTLHEAAVQKYGKEVKGVSAPYWVDEEIVRVGISLGNMVFGANFYYKKGIFN